MCVPLKVEENYNGGGIAESLPWHYISGSLVLDSGFLPQRRRQGNSRCHKRLVRLIDYATFCQLRLLLDENHLTAAQVAAELKLDPKTVAKWAWRTSYQRRPSARRPSKLDAFKGQLVALLERHAYSARQILQQLKPQGYGGGYSILKEFVHLVRPVPKPAFLMLEFVAGECAQVDWGSFGSLTVGSSKRRLSFFVMVLCFSRLLDE